MRFEFIAEGYTEAESLRLMMNELLTMAIAAGSLKEG
jgi:hypothetical protein